MTLFAFALALGVVLGYILHGRLSNLALIRLRWWGIIPAALVLQLGPLPQGGGTDLLIRTIILSLSYAMIVVFTLVNVRVPGMVLIMVGVIANFAVISANGGMPVSAEALRDSGQSAVLTEMRESAPDTHHHLVTEEDSLTFLGDVIGVPAPIARAISVGDIIVCLGLIWFIASSMRGPGARKESRSRAGPSRGRKASPKVVSR